jgi:hypothetical protein
MENVWVPASEAFNRDFQRQGANVVNLAADGLLRSRAAALIIDRSPPQRDIELKTDFWNLMRRMTGSAYRDWKAGTFTTAIPNSVGIAPSGAQRAVGVQFHRSDMDAYLPDRQTGHSDAARAHPSPTSAAKPSGRPRAKGWDSWIAQLALAVFEGQVAADMRDDHLIDLINTRLSQAGHEEMSRATVQPAAKAVLEAFRADADQ